MEMLVWGLIIAVLGIAGVVGLVWSIVVASCKVIGRDVADRVVELMEEE